MATKRRMPWETTKFWPEGEYTLLVDSYTGRDGVAYSKGDTLTLSQSEATKLGNAGTIASPGSMHAVRARVEGGRSTKRDEYLHQMWELSGVWD
jgi:hypothetical protein